MNEQNGGLPEGAILGTPEILEQYNAKWVALPRASARAGRPVMVKIQAIDPYEYLVRVAVSLPAHLQPAPPAPDEPAEETTRKAAAHAERVEAWVAGLTAERREDWDRRRAAMPFRTIAAGLLDPAVTEETARRYGDDAAFLWTEILRFSGMLSVDPAAQPV